MVCLSGILCSLLMWCVIRGTAFVLMKLINEMKCCQMWS